LAKICISGLSAAVVRRAVSQPITAAAAPAGCEDRTHTSGCKERPLMQIFANLLRWLAGSGARRAHVKRADDLLKKLSRSLSSK